MGGNKSYLPSVGLANETCGIRGGVAVLGETETLYVRMDGDTRRAGSRDGRGWREGVVSDGGRLLLHLDGHTEGTIHAPSHAVRGKGKDDFQMR